MKKNQKRKLVITVIIALILAFAFMDSLDIFNPKPYKKVPHGNQTLYVPKDANPSVPLDSFPTSPPGPNQKITPYGKIVMKK